jgi:hypothetical protein
LLPAPLPYIETKGALHAASIPGPSVTDLGDFVGLSRNASAPLGALKPNAGHDVTIGRMKPEGANGANPTRVGQRLDKPEVTGSSPVAPTAEWTFW